MAIDETQIQELQKGLTVDIQVNSSYDLINRTIMAVKNDIENIIGLCDGLMQKIDYSERYCWKNNKEKIMQQESINLDNGSLENYLTMHALVNKK